MRVLLVAVVLIAVAGCGYRGSYCMTVSTSPDQRFRLEGWSEPGPLVAMPGGGGCGGKPGWVRLKDLRSGNYVDDVHTDTLSVVGREAWSATQVSVDIGRTDLVTHTFTLPP